MTEEDFLKRWSRRKRGADAAKAPPQPHTDETKVVAPETAAASKSAEAPQADFDPATLPPIDSITAMSDITAFLRAGVPVELTRAALRRVWTADPAIRDFVGLAENAWDFTDPNAMTGFGPLESTDEVRRMIAQVVDQIGEAARTKVADKHISNPEVPDNSEASEIETGSGRQKGALPRDENTSRPTAERAAETLPTPLLVQSNNKHDAMQRDPAEDIKQTKQLSHRTHGGALPR